MPGSDPKCWPGFICLVLRLAGRVSRACHPACSVRRGRLRAGCRAPGQPGGVPSTQTAPGTELRGQRARPGRRCPPLWRLGRQVEPAARRSAALPARPQPGAALRPRGARWANGAAASSPQRLSARSPAGAGEPGTGMGLLLARKNNCRFTGPPSPVALSPRAGIASSDLHIQLPAV